jgi:hypothetical protein
MKTSQTKREERFYSVVGYICETDTFAKQEKPKSKKAIYFLLEMQEPIVSLWRQTITPDTNS